MTSSAQRQTLIVVVTYNRSDVTSLMFQSLALAKDSTKFFLYVIDNCSRDEEFKTIQNSFEKWITGRGLAGTLLRNTLNSGYAAGNNIGIKYGFEKSDHFSHICLLNNDTIVTDHWLERLLSHRQDGIIGLVTNSVGNEQIIPIDYSLDQNSENNIKTVSQFADTWFRNHEKNLVPSRMLGFFCVIAPTHLMQRIGLLDEKFGVGMFEDDDYCTRARNLNIGLFIARDVFIHHWGSASFSKIDPKAFRKIFDTNRAYLEAKHGEPWKPYVTTLVDAFKHEIEWCSLHPSDQARKAADFFEQRIKAQITHLNMVEQIQNSQSLLELMESRLRSSASMSPYLRGVAVLSVMFLRCFTKEQGSLKRFLRQFKSYTKLTIIGN